MALESLVSAAGRALRQWFPDAELVDGRDLGALNLRAAAIAPGHLVQVLAFEHYRDIRGLITDHQRPDDGTWCAGSVWFADRHAPQGVNAWTVVGDSPLTLSPSIACPRCPVHGFIHEGKWVAA